MQEEQHSSKKVVRNSTGATITLDSVYFLGGRDENGNELDYNFIAYE